jgi:hypothetical protein
VAIFLTDTLVELLISTVHRIGARADRKVTEELVNAFKRVTGKENILFAIAEASLDSPDESVREVVFPAVAGGEQTLRELVHEFKTKGPVYRRTVQTTLKASYSRHYRRGLIALLGVLEFRSNNDTPPAGPRRSRSDPPVRRQPADVLPDRRDGTDPQGAARRLDGAGVHRPGQGPAAGGPRRVRDLHVPGAA